MERRRMRTVVYVYQNTCDITVAYFAASVVLFQPVLSRWTVLSIWTTWTVLSAHEPYCLRKLFLTRLLKSGYSKKFLEILIKRLYGATHIALIENFEQKTIRFNPYCLLRKISPKDNVVQPILSFKKTLSKRQYGSTHIVF